jgi:carboxypeptidase Taq
VLQDVHWGEGLFGYFPTYALGNVIAGQVWARIERELPALPDEIAAGEFGSLRAWLAEHVHRLGRRRTPDELVREVCGSPLDPQPYLAYLDGRVRASAALMP